MPKIFVTRPIPETGLQILYKAFGEASIDVFPDDRLITRKKLLERVQGLDALLPILMEAINGEVLDAAGPHLKTIANFASDTTISTYPRQQEGTSP